MKTSASIQLVAAGVLSLASLALGVPYCAITCFQDVVTEHPPLTCTEENMYLCFCKDTGLQGYFLDCVYSECGDDVEEAIDFGVDLCQELGAPITVPPRPTPSASSTDAPSVPSATNTPPASKPTESPPSSKPSGGDSTSAPPTEPSATGEPTESSGPEPTGESSAAAGYPTASASSDGYGNSTSAGVPSGTGTGGSASPTGVTVNMGTSKNAGAGVLAAGIAMAAFQLL